ncbi:hypothetical protein H2200_013179 [Cladophialophora chaetospira]|uniref:Uncharacterized protein n=1 Tax=Cladophialophora chaetospira TaxID=386627 RepID=A0AA38WWB7_9EURO|nr:hypothetical protein H2200_013179 [Cladophialophora chaetospira]
MAGPLIIGVVLFAIAFCSAVVYNCYYMYRRRGMMRAPRMRNAEEAAAFDAERQALMDGENDVRRRQEDDKSKGTPVWFSRWIKNGSLRHWVLYTHHTKYELRLPADMTSLEKLATMVLSTSQYICNPTEWDKEEEIMNKRQEYLEKEGKPYTDAEGYYICLIGWTDQTKEEIDATFANVAKQLGSYNVYHNCQWLLKHFAKEILNKHQAADYSWFAENVKTEYQKLLELPPTHEIVAFQLQMLRAAAANSGAQLSIQENNRIQHLMHRHAVEGAMGHGHGGHHGAASQLNNSILFTTIMPGGMPPGPPPGMAC